MWYYNNQPVTEMPADYVGFVYLIENLTNGRLYVGKKLFKFSKSKQVKGKRKKFLVESDWQDYYGSNDELKEDVARLGSDNFKRTILYYCKNKGSMSYLELREQMDRRVLELDTYYNAWVSAKIHKKHVKIDT